MLIRYTPSTYSRIHLQRRLVFEGTVPYALSVEIDFENFQDNKNSLNRRRIILLCGIVIACVLILVLFVQSNAAKNNQKAQQYFETAQMYFTSSQLDLAEIEIQKALSINVNSKEFTMLLSEINSTKSAMKEIEDAKALIENNEYKNAYKILKSVKSALPEVETEAKGLLNQLKPIVLNEAQIKISKLIIAKEYSEAESVLNDFSTLFAGDTDFSSVFTKKHAEIKTLKAKQSQLALSKLSKRYDKFQDITWYTSASSPKYRNSNAFYIYFGMSDNSKLPLRLVVQYESSDWLFIDSAQVNVDGENYSIAGNWERDNNSRIWEWIDEKLDDRDLVESIIKSKSATIRFDGTQYFDTRSISTSQKNALKDVLTAYDGQRD